MVDTVVMTESFDKSTLHQYWQIKINIDENLEIIHLNSMGAYEHFCGFFNLIITLTDSSNSSTFSFIKISCCMVLTDTL